MGRGVARARLSRAAAAHLTRGALGWLLRAACVALLAGIAWILPSAVTGDFTGSSLPMPAAGASAPGPGPGPGPAPGPSGSAGSASSAGDAAAAPAAPAASGPGGAVPVAAAPGAAAPASGSGAAGSGAALAATQPPAPQPRTHRIDIASTGHQAEIDRCEWVRMNLEGSIAPIVGAHNTCGAAFVLDLVPGDRVELSGQGLTGNFVVTGSRDGYPGQSARVATAGLSASVMLQTCYFHNDDVRLVTLDPAP
ncbi:hypothetical protein [Leucobacter luti]|uniref:hypothetical protein n=1 Tax=Leucobacter luti TaxID=340320 RepID=UPI003D0657CF